MTQNAIMKVFALFVCTLLVIGTPCLASRSNDSSAVVKIAVFAPVYIDSAFSGNVYKVTDNVSLPKNILPGLEFYNGVMLAIDSLQKELANIEVLFFDTKSIEEPLSKVLRNPVWDSVSLIIASFNNRQETKLISDLSALKKIPILSATYPNDAGIANNPYFVMLNPTLRTHCEALYKHIQRNYSTGNIVMFRRKGAVEDMIQQIFGEMARKTPGIPLKIKTVQLTDTFTTKQMLSYLDSNKQNIVVCGAVYEPFGIRLVQALNEAKNYSSTAIGMPTWDGLKELSRPVAGDKSKGVEIVYSTPYNFQLKDNLAVNITTTYKNKYYARPSDWVLKGYESMYHFSHLLLQYGKNFMQYLSSKEYKLFNDYEVSPVRHATPTQIDYLENKKLYFIKKQDGVVKSVS